MSVRLLIRRKLKRTNPRVHKGDFGRIFIVSGSRGMTGACRLASMAALRAGAGLVTIGAPSSLARILTRESLEAMWLPLPETVSGAISKDAVKKSLAFLKNRDVLAIGPGLSRHPSTQEFTRQLILRSTKPMAIDADAIVALCGNAKLLKRIKAPAVLTPHAGEFHKLTGKLPLTEKERLIEARSAAKRLGVVIVLKGHRTVVADPSGKYYINKTGNPGMATGGMGDVLTGIIAAFLGQKLTPFEAACCAAYVHGLAGDRASRKAGQISLLPRDVLEEIPLTLKSIIGR